MNKSVKTEQLKMGLEELKTLRDQIRVDIHLAGMDLRDEWRELERRLPEASGLASELKDSAQELLATLTTELRTFAARLRDRDQPRV